MYERYDIKTHEAPPTRFVPNKFKPTVRRLGLAKMLIREALHYRFDREIILSRPCIYGVFSGPVGGFWPIRQKCVGCMRCVLEYPEFCDVSIDERYKRLGDSYFDPDSVGILNFEATTGKIQVKGVGYKGPFSGPGFDAIWTDMSEIVRPTRDGIYGREYISTAVDIGRKPKRLPADRPCGPILSVPLPVLFDDLPWSVCNSSVDDSIARASRRLGTFFISRRRPERRYFSNWCPLVESAGDLRSLPKGIRFLEYAPAPGLSTVEPSAVRAAFPEAVAAIRVSASEKAAEEIISRYRAGWGVFHITADYHGREIGSAGTGRFITDSLLEAHRRLVKEGIRDEITLIVSGGIIRAEHLPKAIICGADVTAINTPLLVALHAEFQGDCKAAEAGTLKTPQVDPKWGCQRIVNFSASWRNQLLEIVSAMGIRDVRRLRGETGRAMFFQDLEKEWLSAAS